MDSYVEKLFSLKNTVAIVTNSDRELGGALVRGLAQADALVYGIGDREISQWQPDKNEFYLGCNPQNPQAFQLLCQKLYQQHSGFHSLVNIAEISTSTNKIEPGKPTKISFQQAIESELKTAIERIQIAATYMQKSQGGAIVNVISLKDAIGFPDDFSYIATKNALLMMTKKLAVSLIKNNIRVNNVVIGYVAEASPTSSHLSHQWQDLIKTTVYLISSNSGMMTGQDIFIIGDRTAPDEPPRIFASIDWVNSVSY